MQPTLIKGLCSGRSWSGFVHIDEVEGGVSRAGLPIDLRCRNRTTTVLYCTVPAPTRRTGQVTVCTSHRPSRRGSSGRRGLLGYSPCSCSLSASHLEIDGGTCPFRSTVCIGRVHSVTALVWMHSSCVPRPSSMEDLAGTIRGHQPREVIVALTPERRISDEGSPFLFLSFFSPSVV